MAGGGDRHPAPAADSFDGGVAPLRRASRSLDGARRGGGGRTRSVERTPAPSRSLPPHPPEISRAVENSIRHPARTSAYTKTAPRRRAWTAGTSIRRPRPPARDLADLAGGVSTSRLRGPGGSLGCLEFVFGRSGCLPRGCRHRREPLAVMFGGGRGAIRTLASARAGGRGSIRALASVRAGGRGPSCRGLRLLGSGLWKLGCRVHR